jgi:RNA-directed DNA polymerase
LSASDLFKKSYQIDNIKGIYDDKVRNKCSPGLDRINKKAFEKRLDENISIINRKVLNGTYRFTNYKQKLISKGEGKKPRVISIPTIRDKVTLMILKNIIVEAFGEQVSYALIHKIVKDILNLINNDDFDYYLKIDLSQFYDTINHDLLTKQLKQKIRKKEILQLISNALITPTVEENYSKGSKKLNEKGVPQGQCHLVKAQVQISRKRAGYRKR